MWFSQRLQRRACVPSDSAVFQLANQIATSRSSNGTPPGAFSIYSLQRHCVSTIFMLWISRGCPTVAINESKRARMFHLRSTQTALHVSDLDHLEAQQNLNGVNVNHNTVIPWRLPGLNVNTYQKWVVQLK